MSLENPNFLKKKYDLHNAPEVEQASHRTEVRTGEEVPQDPASQIQNYLDRFKEITEREDPHEREKGMEALKTVLHRNLVIKPEDIPQSYFDNQKRIAREQGHGNIEITQSMKDQLTEVITTDQETTLDTWIDYLASEDATYPDWLKYYAFRSMVQMGEYDKEKKQFTKRSKGTVKPFPDLNREALAYVLDAIQKKYQKQVPNLKDLDPEEQQEFEKILQSENFAKLYAWAIEKVTPATKESLENTKGEWVKYDRNSDHMPLVQSLQGHGTGWCTAGESTAQAQLKNGDFYVYYSLDAQGNPTIPRAAIRMQDKQIAEVRGIAPDQNLDPYIGDVVKEKLAEFPDGKVYEQKSEDMKRLTEIDRKVEVSEELTQEDLKFLYEIDHKIQGFGYQRDPRIDEILDTRTDKKADLSLATGYPKEQISLTEEGALSGNIKFHYGGLDLRSLTSAEGLKLPDSVGGYINLSNLTSAEGLKLPASIGGHIYLSNLTSAEGLKLPDSIGGCLDLRSLTSAEGLKLPDSIGGDLDLRSLTSAEGLKLPASVGGHIYLSNLTSAEGLKLPDSIGGYIYLSNLTSTKGLKLPASIGGSLDLRSLTSAEGLKLPDSIGGYIDLRSLTSAEGLKLPDSIGGYIDLRSLTSAEGLKLPDSIGGSLDLSNLTSAEGLKLPDSIGGYINLRSLTSAEGLKLPDSIGGDLDLRSLTSAEGLKLPDSIGGYINLRSLTSAEGLKLPDSIGRDLDLRSLRSAKGLKLPASIGGSLDLGSLISAKGLKLPASIGGVIFFPILLYSEKDQLRKEYPQLTIA